MRTLKDKILTCLREQPATRNSDTSLTNYLWLNFYKERLFQNESGDWCVKIKYLYDLPTQDDVKRIRAKIQNQEHKFLPTDLRIVQQRKINEELWRSQLGYNPELRTI